MNKKINLTSIINERGFCIRNNPRGIKRLWPKSYIRLFYDDFFNNLYKKNKSPYILEINQLNNLNIDLWRTYFKKGIVNNLKKQEILSSKYKNYTKYDVIIVPEITYIKNKKEVKEIINLLNQNGVIIIEDVGRNLEIVNIIYLNFFLNFELKIYDFRLDRFLLKNCILTLKKDIPRFHVFKKLKSFLDFLKFFIFETMISIIMLLIKIKNRK